MYKSFRPGKFWYDNNKNLIQAHGGAILYVDGKYWFYGENKEGITGSATGEECKFRHHGLKLYSSTDLYNWVDEGILFAESDDEDHPFHPINVIDRPHIIYNKKTGLYVMWVKGGRRTNNQSLTNCTFVVCVGKDLKSFKLLKEFTPEPHHAGDFDIFEADDKAYIVFENPHSEMICRELTDDYTGLGEKWSSHLQFECPPFIREAPAFFERNGRRFLITSGTTSYYANPSIVYDITDIHGEWKEIGNPCINDIFDNSFHAQFSTVFKHPFIEDLYIALGDRWLIDCTYDMPNMCDVFYSLFTKRTDVPKVVTREERKKFSDVNTSLATYVWLPIKFDEQGNPFIEWKREWDVNNF